MDRLLQVINATKNGLPLFCYKREVLVEVTNRLFGLHTSLIFPPLGAHKTLDIALYNLYGTFDYSTGS